MLRCVVATAIACAAAVQSTKHPRPSEILHDVQTIGAKATLNELYRDDETWIGILRGIAGGTPEWLAVAEALRPVADAHPAEALAGAVGEALGRNARLILSHAAGPFFLSDVCGAPDVDDDRFDKLPAALSELNRRVRGVERVQDPALAQVRTDCLNSLHEGEAKLREFFRK